MPSREVSLAQHRPDLSAWLDMILAKAVEVDADKRFGDTMELAFELEDGLVHGAQKIPEKRPLIERDSVMVWQAVSFLLALILIAVLLLQN